jgi:type 1 fimbria pilin
MACAVLLATASLGGTPTQAVTLNFSAVLTPGTCTFDLDKSTLSLGYISSKLMLPATLVAAKPFTLKVSRCSGIDPALTPVVSVTGDGVDQGGKWLFRDTSSTAAGTGVMLVKTSSPPDYSATETKNGDTFALAKRGENPVDQDMTFYAGLTCGVCASVAAGKVTARITFSLDYL